MTGTLPFPRSAPGPALEFAVTGADQDPHALGPTLRLSVRVTETTGTRVHALALRAQIRIEPAARSYGTRQQERLVELFGEPERWGRTLTPLQLATVSTVTQGFVGELTAVLEIPLTFDTEMATTRYFRGVDDGEIPLRLLFSGTVFYEGPSGVQIGLVPWSAEAAHRLPAGVWADMAATHHGGTTWLRLPEHSLAALSAWRAARALPSWERTIDALLAAAGETTS